MMFDALVGSRLMPESVGADGLLPSKKSRRQRAGASKQFEPLRVEGKNEAAPSLTFSEALERALRPPAPQGSPASPATSVSPGTGKPAVEEPARVAGSIAASAPKAAPEKAAPSVSEKLVRVEPPQPNADGISTPPQQKDSPRLESATRAERSADTPLERRNPVQPEATANAHGVDSGDLAAPARQEPRVARATDDVQRPTQSVALPELAFEFIQEVANQLAEFAGEAVGKTLEGLAPTPEQSSMFRESLAALSSPPLAQAGQPTSLVTISAVPISESVVHDLFKAGVHSENGSGPRQKMPTGKSRKPLELAVQQPSSDSSRGEARPDSQNARDSGEPLSEQPVPATHGEPGELTPRRIASIHAGDRPGDAPRRPLADPAAPHQQPAPTHSEFGPDLARVASRTTELARPMHNPQRAYAARDMIRLERTAKGGRAAMQLDLGDGQQIELRLEVEEGVARVVMSSRSAELHGWLHRSADQLMRALVASGLQLDGVDVDTSGQESGGRDERRRRGDSLADDWSEPDVETVWLDALPSKIHIVT